MKAQTQANQDVSAALDLLKVTLKEENDRIYEVGSEAMKNQNQDQDTPVPRIR